MINHCHCRRRRRRRLGGRPLEPTHLPGPMMYACGHSLRLAAGGGGGGGGYVYVMYIHCVACSQAHTHARTHTGTRVRRGSYKVCVCVCVDVVKCLFTILAACRFITTIRFGAYARWTVPAQRTTHQRVGVYGEATPVIKSSHHPSVPKRALAIHVQNHHIQSTRPN